MAEKKLARIPNFSPAEKESLMNIVMKYASVLEDKRTNRTSIEEKAEIWKKIESEFNNSTPVFAFRSHDQLKRLYDNKKKDIRKKLAEHKKEIYLTGGGPAPPDIVLNRVDNLLLQVLNEKSVKGFSSEFDSDKYFNQDDSLTITQKENFEPIPKKKKTDIQDTSNNVEDVNIFEFVPTDVTDNGNKDIIPESICYNQSTRCPPAVLQKPINSKLIPHRETSEATTSSTIVSTPGNERRKNKIPQSNRRIRSWRLACFNII